MIEMIRLMKPQQIDRLQCDIYMKTICNQDSIVRLNLDFMTRQKS